MQRCKEKKKNKSSNATKNISDCDKFNHVKPTIEPGPLSIPIKMEKCKVCDNEFNKIQSRNNKKCGKCKYAFEDVYKNYYIQISFNVLYDSKPTNNNNEYIYIKYIILNNNLIVTKTFLLTKLIKQSYINKIGEVHLNCKYLKLYNSDYTPKTKDGWYNYNNKETIISAKIIKLNQIDLTNDN